MRTSRASSAADCGSRKVWAWLMDPECSAERRNCSITMDWLTGWKRYCKFEAQVWDLKLMFLVEAFFSMWWSAAGRIELQISSGAKPIAGAKREMSAISWFSSCLSCGSSRSFFAFFLDSIAKNENQDWLCFLFTNKFNAISRSSSAAEALNMAEDRFDCLHQLLVPEPDYGCCSPRPTPSPSRSLCEPLRTCSAASGSEEVRDVCQRGEKATASPHIGSWREMLARPADSRWRDRIAVCRNIIPCWIAKNKLHVSYCPSYAECDPKLHVDNAQPGHGLSWHVPSSQPSEAIFTLCCLSQLEELKKTFKALFEALPTPLRSYK